MEIFTTKVNRSTLLIVVSLAFVAKTMKISHSKRTSTVERSTATWNSIIQPTC